METSRAGEVVKSKANDLKKASSFCSDDLNSTLISSDRMSLEQHTFKAKFKWVREETESSYESLHVLEEASLVRWLSIQWWLSMTSVIFVEHPGRPSCSMLLVYILLLFVHHFPYPSRKTTFLHDLAHRHIRFL